MTRPGSPVPALTIVAGLALGVTPSWAQDSVSQTPGVGGDAIGAFDGDRQTVNFRVDLVDFTSSWGQRWGIAPGVKSGRDADVLFNTLALGSIGFSPDLLPGFIGAEEGYAVWNGAGLGVGAENVAPTSASISAFDNIVGLAISDLNSAQSSAIGAMIGWDDDEPDALYIRRTIGAQSRTFSFLDDNGTVSGTAIDAAGNLHIRADGFNGTGSNQILGDNILTVDLYARDSGLNGITKSGTTNVAFDAGATDFALINVTATTLGAPGAFPASLGTPAPVSLDLSGDLRFGDTNRGMSHYAATVDGHRGNPTVSTLSPLSGISVGTIASLAKGSGPVVDTLNAFAISDTGVPVSAISATLPSPMPTDPSLNSAGDAFFNHYNNQTVFRGSAGHVAIGGDDVLLLAATATDPVQGDFIAIARIGTATTWSVVARVGSNVLDGPDGAVIGTLASDPIAAFSSPAIDGNADVYFVGRFDAPSADPVNALFRAVESGSGYAIELIVKEGDAFTGENSLTPYTIDRIFLADSDSVASSGFNAMSVQRASGLIALGAVISYDRSGTPETYDTVLLLRTDITINFCSSDFDGDGDVDLTDFGSFGAAFNSMIGDANYNADADFDGDGDVDLTDFGAFGAQFNRNDCLPN